jgi:hypothetical protein
MAEKPQGAKLASRSKGQVRKTAGQCTCGGDLIWSMVFNPRGRMMKVCEKCGIALPKAG